MDGHTRPALCDGQGQGHAQNQVNGDRRERKGYARVEESLVLAAGKVIEVILDSHSLPVWTGKLLFFHVNTVLQKTGDG